MRRTALALAILLAAASCSSGDLRPPSARPEAGAAATLRFAAVGDIGDGSRREERVAEAIAREHRKRPIELLLLLGDLIYRRGDPQEYEEKFARPYRGVLDAGIETAAVLGNHDVRTDIAGMMRAFGMRARFYTFTRGPVQFFALDSNPGRILSAQRGWLRRELEASRAPWKVAFMHIPPFASGVYGTNRLMQQTFVDLFERYRVDLVLAGHEHHYERTRAIRGVTYVVSGGGCCPRPAGRSDFTARSFSGLHFTLFEASPTQITIEAIADDGALIDRATIGRARAAA